MIIFVHDKIAKRGFFDPPWARNGFEKGPIYYALHTRWHVGGDVN